MAGTLTVTADPSNALRTRPLKKFTFTWTCDASGVVSGTLSERISGTIVQVITNPGATAPTDNYDVTCLDDQGRDVFSGQGANRDTANTEHFCPGVPFADGTTTSLAPVVVDSTLELQIANAGNAKQGVLVLLVR